MISARKSLRISAKTFFFGDYQLLAGKFVISARKSLRISAKTCFFFGDHLLLAGKDVKIGDFGHKKPSEIGENFCPHDFNFAPSDLAKLATPLCQPWPWLLILHSTVSLSRKKSLFSKNFDDVITCDLRFGLSPNKKSWLRLCTSSMFFC